MTDKSTGLTHRNGNITIFVKTWAQVIDDNKARMQFFQEHLELQTDKGEALKYLQDRHAQYLEGVFNEADVESEPVETSGATTEEA